MRLAFISFGLVLVLAWSCGLEEDSLSFDPNLEIVFSNDSVSFDTLLSDSRSTTKRLTLYNRSESAVQFSSIALGMADDSDYSMIVGGKEGTNQVSERILGGDSLLILVEVNVDPRDMNLPYIVKDSIIFNWNGNSEHVKLVAWGQDGNRIINQVICDETWTNDRPYIISDTLLVQPNCELTIEKGTTVYMENDAVIFIQGTLHAVGDSAEHIIFRNARFDGVYDQVPGQWDGIYFLEGSVNNEVAFAEIFNGQVGLRLGTPDNDDEPDVIVRNTQIYNMSVAGILAFTSDLQATNCLIYNCGSYLVGNFAGGNYSYRHCTLSNDPSFFILSDPSVQFSDNIVISDNELLVDDLSVEMINSIVWGPNEEELLISDGGGAMITTSLSNNILKSQVELADNFVSQEFNFPGFSNAFSFDFTLDSLAFSQNRGVNIGVTDDITGTLRDDMPDIGAFERFDQ